MREIPHEFKRSARKIAHEGLSASGIFTASIAEMPCFLGSDLHADGCEDFFRRPSRYKPRLFKRRGGIAQRSNSNTN